MNPAEKETIDRAALDNVLAGRAAPTSDRPGAVVRRTPPTVVAEPALSLGGQ